MAYFSNFISPLKGQDLNFHPFHYMQKREKRQSEGLDGSLLVQQLKLKGKGCDHMGSLGSFTATPN